MTDLPKRKPIRLPEFDYSSNGAYFITFCTKDRQCILGNICADNNCVYCKLSELGYSVNDAIKRINDHYYNVVVPSYCIMPNHVHLTLLLMPPENDGRQVAVPTIVGHLKRAVSMQLGKSIWQARYHDHIIRNEDELNRICEYIDANPIMWEDDYYHL